MMSHVGASDDSSKVKVDQKLKNHKNRKKIFLNISGNFGHFTGFWLLPVIVLVSTAIYASLTPLKWLPLFSTRKST